MSFIFNKYSYVRVLSHSSIMLELYQRSSHHYSISLHQPVQDHIILLFIALCLANHNILVSKYDHIITHILAIYQCYLGNKIDLYI